MTVGCKLVYGFMLVLEMAQAQKTCSSQTSVTGDEFFPEGGHGMLQLDKSTGGPAAYTDTRKWSTASSSSSSSSSSNINFFGSVSSAYYKVLDSVFTKLFPAEKIFPNASSYVSYGAPLGGGCRLAAVQGAVACSKDFYWPSKLELDFSANVNRWTSTGFNLCSHLKSNNWVGENVFSTGEASTKFSRLCRKSHPVEVIEPLAGILRDPTFFCNRTKNPFSIDWLVLADAWTTPLPTEAKSYFFDAGGSMFKDGLNFFLGKYAQRGIVFDHVYVWEARVIGQQAYWMGVPKQVRDFWEPRVTFYDGIPVNSDPANYIHNPVNRIYQTCKEQDFCAFKLDVDTPTVELPLVRQLIDNPGATRRSLDEFYFEHHVHGLMQMYWGKNVNGTFADSYNIFTQLRHMGIRAHSWI